jgi:hypothetical protein
MRAMKKIMPDVGHPFFKFVAGTTMALIMLLGLAVGGGAFTAKKEQTSTESNKTEEGTKKAAPAQSTEQVSQKEEKTYVVPIDSSVKRVSFAVVFRPERRDRTYDLLERTGGQSFYLSPSEVNKVSKIAIATRGEPILIVNDELVGSSERDISIVRPSGEKVIARDAKVDITDWSAGKVTTIANPEFGAWRLKIAGSGQFSIRVTAETAINITRFNFVKLGGRPGHEGYFPIDKEPAIGAEQILQVQLSEDSETSGSPQWSTVDEAGKLIQSLKFYAVTRGTFGEFAGVIKVPSQDFRIMALGTDKNGRTYQRMCAPLIHPVSKPAPLAATEIQDFTKSAEESQYLQQNIANAKVWDVRDELLLSKHGHPLGIRLSYSVRFPRTMRYGQSQVVQASFGKYFVYMQPKNIVVDPFINYTEGYIGGTDYRFRIDMWPFFIRDNDRTGNYCIWHVPAVDEFSRNESRVRFKIRIPDANFEGLTENSYSPSLFYNGATQEGAKDCVY